MGFWSSFFGAGAAHVCNEMKKAEKETQKWNDNLHMTMNYEEEFSNYLKSIGSNAVYISEVDESAASVRNQIDRYKRKIKEFLNLGGEGKYIYDVEELDEYIEVMKYLKSVGYVNRQQEFLGLDLFLVKDEIDRALREDNSSASLVNLKGNILNGIVTKGNDLFIPYDDWEESTNTIKIGTAKLYSEDTVQFLEYKTISLVFTETNIYIYSYELDEHSQLYCNVLIGKNQKIDIASLPIPAVEGWSMVVIDDLQILCVNSEAEKVMELYRKHNADIYLEEMLQQTAAENINQLSGVEFERVCQQLVERMGFETETTKASGDGGIDLIAYNRQPLLSGKYIIQCKRYTGSVGEPIIRDLYGVVMSERANKGILMTTGYFTKSAIAFAEGKPIELIDGEKLHDLLSSFGIAEFDEAEEIDNKTSQDVFTNNIMIEDEYKKYENTIRELDKTNDECKRASFINWLINLTMGEFADIVDFQEKIIIFREIKDQIRKYTDGNRIEKSKLLSYLYQMTYVQLSILEGDFNDAKDMFEKLMEHKELQFSLMETIKESPEEVHITDFLYDHQGVFTWLCYTWYDMVQVAILVDDSSYKMHLTDHNIFYGFPALEKDRLECTIAEIDSGIRNVGNRNYFVEKLNGFKDIDSLVYDEVPLRQLFFIDGYALDVYYRYTYEDDGYLDFAPDIYKIVMDGNGLKIEGMGEIKNIKQKIRKWEKFQK